MRVWIKSSGMVLGLFCALACGEAFQSTGAASSGAGASPSSGQGAGATTSAGEGGASSTATAGGAVGGGGKGGGAVCGNGEVEEGEECDGEEFADGVACAEGSGGGSNVPSWAKDPLLLRCTKGCKADKAGCYVEGLDRGSTCAKAIPVALDLQGPRSERHFAGALPTSEIDTGLPGSCVTQSSFPVQERHRLYKVEPSFTGYISAALKPFGETTFASRLYALPQVDMSCGTEAPVCVQQGTGELFGGEVLALQVTKGVPVYIGVDPEDGQTAQTVQDYHLIIKAAKGTCDSPIWMPLYEGITTKNFLIGSTAGAMDQAQVCDGSGGADVVVKVPNLGSKSLQQPQVNVPVKLSAKEHFVTVKNEKCSDENLVGTTCGSPNAYLNPGQAGFISIIEKNIAVLGDDFRAEFGK